MLLSWFDILNIMLFIYPALMAIYWSTAASAYCAFVEGKLTGPLFHLMDLDDLPM